MRKIEEVMDGTAFLVFGYNTWQDYEDSLRDGRSELTPPQLSLIIRAIAKEYSRDAEKYYKQPECDCIEGKFDLDYREIARHEGFTAGYNEMRNKVKRDLDKLKRKIDQDEY